ncbi:MAG: hypothetical protein Q6356_000140 [Candidatus Wukongarchaeota archaeon]|nr:hypothetical protein [Candidatus Wukongarchaeota archaeon]
MNRRFVFWLPLIITLCSISLCFAVMDMRRVSNVGRIKTIGVGVYKDVECLEALTVIDWGVLELSETKTCSCFVRNEANVPIVLNLTSENWLPVNASSFIFLGGDYAGHMLEVNEVVGVLLSLSVSPDIAGITSFWFDILIAGIG